MFKQVNFPIALLLLLVLVVVSIGCDGDGDGTSEVTSKELVASSITAEDLIRNITKTSDDMKTSEFEMDMVMDMKGTADGESLDMSMSMEATAAMDIPNRKMKMEMTMEMSGDTGDPLMPSDMDMGIYVIDDTMYMNIGDIPGMPGGWMKMEIPEDEYSGFEDIWESQNLTSQQEDLLLEASEVKILGERKVNGVDCYEVSIVPNMDQLLDMMMDQDTSGYLAEDLYYSDTDEVMELSEDYSITYWYDKNTFQPVKMDIEMTMSDDAGMDMSMDMEINMKHLSFNKPVSINLPSGAKNAMDMTGLMDMDW